MMNLHALFPTAVAKFELGRKFTAEEMAFFGWQPTHTNMGNTTSDDRYILRNSVMAELKKFVEESVTEYLSTVYAPKNPVSLRITQSWLNYTKDGQHHHKHAHPNSYLSGVLYVKADEQKDKIYFYRDGYQQIKLPTDNFNLYNSDSWWLPVHAGHLLLFPSGLTHSVETVKGDERISLAFNTFPTGYAGEEDSLTALHL